jgi:hypothetical protein
VLIRVPAVQTEPYRVEFEARGLTGSFDCVPRADAGPDDLWIVENATGDLGTFDEGAAGYPDCWAAEAGVAMRRSSIPPPHATVTVGGSSTWRRTFSPIHYSVWQPNGEMCEPTCYSAVLDLGGRETEWASE